MADHQRVIEFLRDVRQGGPGALSGVTEEITQMAAAYAALCVTANDRLRQCSAFLQQGLRSEAIHLAEESPNLLDLVSQLDLPDPEAWADFCRNNGLPVPPSLQLDRAAQLNEAYAQDQPMEHLLSRHRLLALSRAPLRERLSVMREIARLDPGTPYWEKDIRTFEQARLKELPGAFHAAVKTRDDDAIADLMEEVNRQPWYELVPTDLAKGVADAFARMQRAEAEAELRTLVEPLRDAFAARSLQECQALVQRWKNVLAKSGVTTVGDDLNDEIKPVVAFVAEETRREENLRKFKDGCRIFTRMLDQDQPDAELEAGYAKLREYQLDIPEDLTKRYLAKRAGRRKDAERQHKTRLIAIGSGAAAVIIVAIVLIVLYMHGSAAAAWAQSINNDVKLHTREGLDHALASIDDLKKNHPGMLQEPRVAAAVSAAESEKNQYDQDAASALALAQKLEAARQTASKVNDQDTAPAQDVRNAALALQNTLADAGAQADKLAWADPDKKLHGALAAGQDVLAALRGRVVAAARAEMDAISKDLSAIPTDASTPESVADTEARISALAKRIAALQGSPLLDDAAAAQATALAGQITSRQQGLEASSVVAEQMQEVRSHAGSASELEAGLTAFVTKFDGDRRSADFKKALALMGPAKSLEAWHALTAEFTGGLAAGSPAVTKKRLDAVNAFLVAHPDCPKTADITRYRDYLQRAGNALAEKGIWQNAFADLLATPVLSDLTFLQASDGRKFYTLGNPKRTEHRMNGDVSVSFEVLDPADLTKRVKITIDPPLTVSSNPEPAPHTKVMSDIADALKMISPDNWDSYGIDLASSIAKNNQIDSVVKGILLLPALKTEVAVTGGSPDNPGMLGDVYDRAIAELTRLAPDQMPWTDPSRISDNTRASLEKIAASLPPAADVKKKLAAAKQSLFASVNLDPLTGGMLLKDDAGNWNVYTRAAALDGSELWTIIPDAAATTAPATAASDADAPAAPAATRLVKIGVARENKFVLDDSALQNVPQGNIVYILRPQ